MRSLCFFVPLIGLLACVGDGPAPSDPAADGGASDGSTSNGDGSSLGDASADDGSTRDGGPALPEPPLADAKLWLDARKANSGATSATWSDSSGNGADAVGPIAILAEAGAINGRTAMRFLGEPNQGMRVPANKLSLSVLDGLAVFVVAKAAAKSPAPIYPTFVERTTSPSRNGLWMYWQVPEAPVVQGALFSYDSPVPKDVGITLPDVDVFRPHVYAMRVAGGVLSFSVDGVASSAAPLAGNDTNFPQNDTAPFSVGGSNVETSADYGFSGYLGSVSVYARAIDDASAAAAVAKLKADWGIP